MTKALLDGDLFAYRTAAASEEADENISILRLDRFVRGVLHAVQSDTYEMFLTGDKNFRYEIFPDYKANRKDMVKPKWLSLCQEYLDKEWNAVRAHGCEVDDLLGMNQTDDTVICSIDKDMLMIPGKHYNFVREEHSIVTPEQGIRNFYEQLLKGDTVDGIPGVRGLGKVKAAKLLANCETEKEMFDVAREQYNDDTTMATYGKCLWIWRKQDDIWNMKDQITGRDLFDEELQE